MGSRSRSRGVSPLEHGYSKSGRRYLRKSKSDYSKDQEYDSRSPSPGLQHSGRNGAADGRISEDRSSSVRSSSPRVSRRRASRTPSRSRSPDDNRRNNREKPLQSRCIGVFGLSVYTTQHKIREIFAKFGGIERIQVVIDAQTGRSRGFCFIYYEDLGDAKLAKESCSGMEIDGRRIRVDYSITQRPHAPTPGVYMGKSRPIRERDHYDRYRDDYRSRRRSITPYSSSRFYTSRGERRRRCERSRSRSYSPR